MIIVDGQEILEDTEEEVPHIARMIVDTLAEVTPQRAVIGIIVVVLIGTVDHAAGEIAEVQGTPRTRAGAILTALQPETTTEDLNDRQASQNQDQDQGLFRGLLEDSQKKVENLWQIPNPNTQMIEAMEEQVRSEKVTHKFKIMKEKIC